MRVIPKDKVIFSFNAENPCNYTVEDGETFWVETDDCYSGQIKDASIKRPDIDISIMDCSVGPIEVKGAQEAVTDTEGRLSLRDVSLRLIPYYAWNHRGVGKMDVWFAHELKGLRH